MKGFKGCIDPDCKAYKKIRYQKDDEYCTKCGKMLSYVCAECWKPMENGKERYCISCTAEKEQRRAEKKEAAKKVGGKAVAAAGVMGAAAVAVPKAIKEGKQLIKNAKKVVDTASDLVKMVKK